MPALEAARFTEAGLARRREVDAGEGSSLFERTHYRTHGIWALRGRFDIPTESRAAQVASR